MRRNLIIPVLLLSTFVSEADDNSVTQSSINKQYKECVAVSLFTRQGKEINSIVKDNRSIEETNSIPEGWSVIGVTTKTDSLVSSPYLVICH